MAAKRVRSFLLLLIFCATLLPATAFAPNPPIRQAERISFDPSDFPWYNWSIPIGNRVDMLIAAMTVAEQIGQLNGGAPAIARLGVPAYDYKSEAAHGIGWAGRATVFPASIGMAASFDEDALRAAG